MAGSSITTIKSSDTRGCRFAKETSLPVMSEVSAPPSQDEHMTTDVAQGWVANSPSPLPGDVADSAPVVPTVSVDARNMIPLLLSKRLGIRYSSLDDGVVAASRMIGLSLLIWMLFSKQVLSIHLPHHSRQRKRQKRVLPLCLLPSNTRVRAFPGCLCIVLT